MMIQVQRVILIVHLLQIRAVHLSRVPQQVDEVRKRAQKITEVCEDLEGRKRKRVALTIAGDVVIAMTVNARSLTKSLVVAKTRKGQVARTGKGRIEKIDVVGVEAEVGQILVGVGMGMTGESPRMIGGTEVDMNPMVGVQRVVIVRGGLAVIVTNHVHIDTGGRVPRQLAEKTKSMARIGGRDSSHLAPVLH